MSENTVMEQPKEYYPNVSGLTRENGKPYRYEYRGQGFSNKRQLHAFMVTDNLSGGAKPRLALLISQAQDKLAEVFPMDTEEDIKKRTNLGFFNHNTDTIFNDIELLADAIEGKAKISVVAYTFAFSKPMVSASFILFKPLLNDKGLEAIGDKLESETGVKSLTETAPQAPNTYGNGISTNPLEGLKQQEVQNQPESQSYGKNISEDPLKGQ